MITPRLSATCQTNAGRPGRVILFERKWVSFGERRRSLADGELIPLTSGTPLHARIRGRLEHLILSYFERSAIGEAFSEIDCRIAHGTVRKPDLSSFLNEHWKDLDQAKSPAPFPPDIAVEVLSPSEAGCSLLVNHSAPFSNTARRSPVRAYSLASPLGNRARSPSPHFFL